MATKKTSAFERLPSETLVRIAELVSVKDPPQSDAEPNYHSYLSEIGGRSRSPLFSLLFIKKFKPAAESVLYKSVVLRGPDIAVKNQKPWEATKKLINQILDPKDTLSSYIRELAMVEWLDVYSAGYDVSSLERIIWSIENLQVLYTTKFLGVGWTSESLSSLLSNVPGLKELSIDIEVEDDEWPVKACKILCKFSNQRNLTTRITLPSAQYRRGPPKVSVCHKVATDFFRNFFRSNPDSKLNTLQFTVLRWDPIPIQDYMLHTVVVGVKRLGGNNATSPLDGGFDVQISNGMGGEVGSENESMNRFLGTRSYSDT